METTCFAIIKLSKKASYFKLIRGALITKKNYMDKIGLIYDTPNSEKWNFETDIILDINKLKEYALNEEKIDLNKRWDDLLEIYDTEKIEYLKFIAIVNE